MILDDFPAPARVELAATPVISNSAPAERPKHAKKRPPSAAKRWLSCPASVSVVPLYVGDEESDHALKGTAAHTSLENGMIFGIQPNTGDHDADLNIMGVLEWVAERRETYGKDCKVYAEQVYDIPETGEFGTADITFVTPKLIEVADYKNGYVPVGVNKNAQMILYLLGAIAKFGTRSRYLITVLQPNYHHRDGPYRTYEVSEEDIEWFRKEIAYSIQYDDEFKAGKHCKTTYCPHRANCLAFHAWARNDAADAWYPSDVSALDDSQLAQALDYAEVLHGLRNELRKEAMRRMLQQDRQIEGYKLVPARTDRSFKGDTAREEVFNACRELGATDADLYTKTPESVAGIERFFKAKFKHLGNGKWKQAWDNVVADHLRETHSSLTLEKAIDGRPAHNRGSEFGAITPPQSTNQVTQVI